MLTYRKALLITALICTTVYLFRSRSAPTNYALDPIDSFRSGESGETTIKSSTPTGDSLKPSRPYPPPRRPSKGRQSSQKTLDNTPKSLKDRLRYQYPYDPDGKFPAYIWQTWKYTPADAGFDEALRPQESSWTELHPGFIHEVVPDKTAFHLIRYLYASIPEVQEAYKALPLPVLKADFFRYLILYARGGIYSDIDTKALQSATEWIPKEVPPSSVGLIVGIEADPNREDWKDWYSRRIQFCQWTIQAKAGHPVLRDIIIAITEDTLRMKKEGTLTKKHLEKSIVEFTGPAIWTDIIFNYFNNPEYFRMEKGAKNITWENFTGMETQKKVGDVVVLPITSFSPGVQTMGAKDIDDPMAFVKHDFEGSWKPEWERVKPIIGEILPE